MTFGGQNSEREISAFQFSNAELLYKGKHMCNYYFVISCEMYGYTVRGKFVELSLDLGRRIA
jgi:hypothetical protein